MQFTEYVIQYKNMEDKSLLFPLNYLEELDHQLEDQEWKDCNDFTYNMKKEHEKENERKTH